MDFLDKIDDARVDLERKKYLEEQKELEDFDKMQQIIREKELQDRLEMEKKVPRKINTAATASSNKKSQLKLLAGAVKRKTDDAKLDDKKPKKVCESDKSNSVPDSKQSKDSVSGLLGLVAYGSDESDSDSEQ